ncbi:DUF523 domain-containing protein [Pseudobacillus wudalianchiensis]|uniref:Uncharacterized protein n=1 Tax=Pseudobacillus wudalianchiensis TaxID=1743143 RepID=A0A1B9B7A1_9BACI|nr:DUF523 domain-containing protein [Bacillus wudalianchiensis]OCA91976.1 hypothetical protein A8F95_18895 [Bacillus wudalianchiensis]
MILVSSCLAGLPVRYNGSHSLHSKIRELIENNEAIAVCPELLGGFVTPREPAEIIGGDGEDVLNGRAKIIEKSGRDVTDLYVKGAYKTLEKAQEIKADTVILKEFSPSCGSGMIYNGEFKNERIAGVGVTAALLQRKGFQVISEENVEQFLQEVE